MVNVLNEPVFSRMWRDDASKLVQTLLIPADVKTKKVRGAFGKLSNLKLVTVSMTRTHEHNSIDTKNEIVSIIMDRAKGEFAKTEAGVEVILSSFTHQ